MKIKLTTTQYNMMVEGVRRFLVFNDDNKPLSSAWVGG